MGAYNRLICVVILVIATVADMQYYYIISGHAYVFREGVELTRTCTHICTSKARFSRHSGQNTSLRVLVGAGQGGTCVG